MSAILIGIVPQGQFGFRRWAGNMQFIDSSEDGLKALLLTTLLAVMVITSPAQAVEKHFYVSGKLGSSVLANATNAYRDPALQTQTGFDVGFNIGLAVGYDFGSFRAEGEFAYHRNSVDTFTQAGLQAPADGVVSAMSLMLNGYYDFHLARIPLVPYLGFGIGYIIVKEDYSVSGTPFIDDTEPPDLGYQVMAGLSYKITPTISLTGEYRFFEVPDTEFQDALGTPPSDFDSQYRNHEITLGIRVAF